MLKISKIVVMPQHCALPPDARVGCEPPALSTSRSVRTGPSPADSVVRESPTVLGSHRFAHIAPPIIVT